MNHRSPPHLQPLQPSSPPPLSSRGAHNENGSGGNGWEGALVGWIERRLVGAESEEDGDAGDADGREHRDDGGGSPGRRARRILRTWRSRIGGDEQSSRTAWVAGAWTVLVLVGYRRYCRRGTGGSNGRLTGASSYRSATEAPISLLYRAAREGQILRALLGSSGTSVFYLLGGGRGDGPPVWKRSRVPPQLSSRDLLDTLTETCDSVSALPDSLLAKLVSPALAALPFV